MARERLQKILAHAGIGSRRACEELITAGRVRVNRRIVRQLGITADGHKDRIEVDGKRIVRERPVYYLFHKPRGVVSTLDDPEGRDSLKAHLRGIPERVYPVGRLDFHTSGALLITNDGDLTEALLHPKKKVPKTYIVKLRGDISVEALEQLQNGVVLDDGTKTAPAKVVVTRSEAGSTWLRLTIHQGLNRQIHRMGEAIGSQVTRLARLSFADLDTENLRPGQIRPLRARELEKLMKRYVKTPKPEQIAESAV